MKYKKPEQWKKWMSVIRRGEGNPAWKGGKPKCKCGKVLANYGSKSCFKHRLYIFTKEHRRKISESKKGNKNPMFGKPHVFRGMGKERTRFCEICNKTFIPRKYQLKQKQGKLCSIVCRTFKLKGINAPNWRGGITPLNNIIRRCSKYENWHAEVFKRDNFTCQLCYKRGARLEVDHYPKMFSAIVCKNKINSLEEALNCKELWDVNNGRTLCYKCHSCTKKGRKKDVIIK